MKSEAATVKDYLDGLPEERKTAVEKLRKEIKKNLPKGFAEEMNYGMIGYVVPLSVYPEGYLGDTTKPLPFMNIASQKNNVAVYHMGVYADPDLLQWFAEEYGKACGKKPDMGKSCIRFRKTEDIPYGLIGKLAGKISVKKWISMYESARKKK